jgi:hypothetical protein
MDPRVKPVDDKGEFKPEDDEFIAVIPRLDRGTHLLRSPVTIAP